METMDDVADVLENHTEAGHRIGLRRMVQELRQSLLEAETLRALLENTGSRKALE